MEDIVLNLIREHEHELIRLEKVLAQRKLWHEQHPEMDYALFPPRPKYFHEDVLEIEAKIRQHIEEIESLKKFLYANPERYEIDPAVVIAMNEPYSPHLQFMIPPSEF